MAKGDPREELDPALQRALDAWRVEPARAEFRAALRGSFVAGAPARHEAGPAEDAAAAGEALRAVLDPFVPRAREAFREELRAKFVRGGGAHAHARPTPSSPLRAPAGRARASARRSGAGRRAPSAPRVARAQRTRLLVAGGLLATAAALVLLLLVRRAPASPWSVDPRSFAAAGLAVDGVALRAEDGPAELAARLVGARELRVDGAPLRLDLADVLTVEIAPGSVLDLGAVADPHSDLSLAGARGAFRLATGPGYRRGEQRLEFRTPSVTARVVGTVFGIDCYEDLVCVCCCEGEVATVLASGEAHTVRAGETQFAMRDGTTSFQQGFEPHQAPLREFAASVRSR